MPSMKVTLSAAMRARDVSRPRPEQLAEAAAREESVPPRVQAPRARTAPAPDEAAAAPRRKRRRRA